MAQSPGAYAPSLEADTGEEPPKDKDLPGYRYAKALCESARSNAAPYVGKFKSYWDFFQGKNQWRPARTKSARDMEGWSFRGVVNDLVAVVETKKASITGASTKTFAEPLDENSTYMDRLRIQSAIDHELERLAFRKVRKDTYLQGSITGIGVTMVTAKPDSVTGQMILSLKALDPKDFFWDPSADNLRDCRFVVWEPLLDMSVVRQMFPSKAPQVKPMYQTVAQSPEGITYKTTGADDNLIYGTTGEFAIDSTSTLKARRARVSFVWIKDPDTLIEELRETVLKEATPGYQCVSCDTTYEQDYGDGLNDLSSCPMCGGDLESVTIPAKVQSEKVVQRAYPYGRLIVYSGDTLLYDGENPYEIESVFPFAAYHHFRIPGVFVGYGDVALLESLQEETNTTVGQGIDYVRLAVNAPIIYPVTFKSITDLGNGPNEKLPGPPQSQWLPFRLSPSGFDTQTWTALIGVLERKFDRVSGLASLGMGQTSSPPISATEAEISTQGPSSRMKEHAEALGEHDAEVAQIVYQLGRQFYGTSKIPVQMPGSGTSAPEIVTTDIEWQSLPQNIRVRVHIGLEEAQLDKLHGQVLQGFIAQGGLQNPDADIILTSFGLDPSEIKELMARRAQRQELGIPGPAPVPMGEPQGAPQIGGGM